MHWLIRKDQAPAFKHQVLCYHYLFFISLLFIYVFVFYTTGKERKNRD